MGGGRIFGTKKGVGRGTGVIGHCVMWGRGHTHHLSNQEGVAGGQRPQRRLLCDSGFVY